jgi:formylglycine-generating enzyme required for sulfatase activity
MTNYFRSANFNFSLLFKLPLGWNLMLVLLSSFMFLGYFLLASPAAIAQTDKRNAAVIELAGSNKATNGKRVALVVGNGNYTSIGSLGDNPRNDADDMARALEGFGFTVTRLKDGTRRDMNAALEAFGRQASGSEAALFYFAGHGMQIRNENYLMPVNATADSEAAVKDEGVSLSRVLDELEGSSAVKILLIDACRDNPITGKFRSTLRGLALPSSPPSGTVIAFAAEPGKTAANGSGRNGVFTAGLLKALQGKDLSLDGVLTVASEEVEKHSNRKQTPYVNGPKTVQKNFHFRVTVSPSTQMLDSEYWASVKDSKDVADFEAYLAEYPQGQFKRLAENRVKALKVAAAPAPQTTQRPMVAAPPTAPTTAPVIAVAAPVQGASSFQAGQAFKDCADCPDMVVIPAGSFLMGSPAKEVGRSDDEGPQRNVTIKSFAMGKTEVTQGQWRSIMGSNPSWFKDCGDECPVEQVSWNYVQEYIKKLNAKTGKIYSLPSEAQWEYAARGGTNTIYQTGKIITNAQANFGANKTTKVASLNIPNNFGLHDMHGNVWEWTRDLWHDNYKGAPTDGNAWLEGGFTNQYVLRGGSWEDRSESLRSATRTVDAGGVVKKVIGFRLARTL